MASERTTKKLPHILVSGLGGLAALTVLIAQWLPVMQTPTRTPWFVGLSVGGLAAIGLYLFLQWRQRISVLLRSGGLAVLTSIVCLLLGCLAVFVIPLAMPPLMFRGHEKLAITATGEHNPLAQSTEVWVGAVQRMDGSKIANDEFTFGAGWYIKNDIPLAGGQPPAALEWEGEVRGALEVHLHSHPWSGIAEITWNGKTQRIDLYSATGTWRKIRLAVPPPWPHLDTVLSIWIYVAHVILLALAIFVVSDLLVNVRTQTRLRCGWWRWGVYGGVMVLVWSVSLAAYWPALMSSDSIDQWREMIRWDLTDAHPALSTMLYWLATRAYESPASIAIMQILVLAAISGWGLWRLRRDGVPAIIIWLTLVLYAVSTVNSRLVITVWKDVLFSAFMLLFVLILREVVATRGAALRRWSMAVALVTTGVLISVLRHNGLPAAVGGIGVLALFYWRHWWRVFLLGVALGVGIFVVRGPLYAAAGVDGVMSFNKMKRTASSIGHHTTWLLAAHFKAGTPLTEEEYALVKSVVNPETLGKNYDPFRRDLMRHVNWHREAIKQLRPQIDALVDELNRRAPDVYWRHIYWRTSLVWRIAGPYDAFYSRVLGEKWEGRVYTIYKNPYGLKSQPISAAFQDAYAYWMAWLQRGNGFWLNWRPALQLWLFLLAVVIAAIRTRNPAYLVLAAPIVIHSYFVAMLAPAQDFRYQYPVWLCGMLLAPTLCFVARCETSNAQPEVASNSE